MTEQELNALVDERFKAFQSTITAAKAEQTQTAAAKAEPTQTATPAPQTTAPTATPAIDINKIVADAVKATADRYEPLLVAARRAPVPGAPTVIRPKGEDNTFGWAVKALSRYPQGSIIFSDGEDGTLHFRASGDDGAMNRFVEYAQKANADVVSDGTRGQIAAKAMTIAGSNVGSQFIPTLTSQNVIEALYALAITRTIADQYGNGVYPMAARVVDAPSIGTFSYGWVADTSSVTSGGDATTGKKTLTAHKLTSIAKLSNDLVRMSNPQAELWVRRGLAGAIAQGFDEGALVGTGAPAPTGLNSESGPASTAYATDLYTSILAAIGRMLTNKVPQDRIVVIGHPGALIKALQSRSSTPFDISQAPLGSLAGSVNVFAPLSARLGVPVFSSPLLPVATGTATSTVFVLHAPSWTVGIYNELELSASNTAGAAFEDDQTFIRAIMHGDVSLQRAVALEKITAVPH